jgi:hypothetical protein
MGIFRPSRERRGPDPHLERKITIFAIGAAFGIAGVATGRSWLTWIGIAILAVGVLLRFRSGRDDTA